MKKIFLLFPLVFALIFIYLFKEQQAGVNVLLFNLLLLGCIYCFNRLNLSVNIHMLLVSGSVISAVMVLLYGSNMAMTANIISLIVLLGFVSARDIRLLLNGIPSAVNAAVVAPYYYFNEIILLTGRWSKGRKLLRIILVVLAPLIFLLIFTSIYATASPYFNNFTGGILEQIGNLISRIVRFISPDDFWLFVGGFLICIAFLSGRSNNLILFFSESKGMDMLRKRRKFMGRMMNLKTEYWSGVVMLVLLNLVIAVMNVLDIYNVWFFFEWNGSYLKQFVHEGTWLLICSILISIIIVLYYFRANLNFYPKRKLLLNLAIIWLAQNALLAVSVGIRNMWYIHHFNLAYKRIGVYAFLLLTLFGLLTVVIKIRKRKTHHYLFYTNGLAAYAIMICLGFFNWDKIIATFNVTRSQKAFFHPEYMITLNSSALPELQQSTLKLDGIKTAQLEKFDYYRKYMPLEDYRIAIEARCRNFVAGYPSVSWLSWNYADYQAYKMLTKK